MLPGLASFLCLCLLVTLFSVQTSGTSNVHIEILNTFIQVGLTQKSVLQISYIKQPPVSALLLVFPLSCLPCQASDTFRAFQPFISSWFPLIFLFPHDPKLHFQGTTPPWDPWPHWRVWWKKYQQFPRRLKWSPDRNFDMKPKVSPPLVWAQGTSYRNQNFLGFLKEGSFSQRWIWVGFFLVVHAQSLTALPNSLRKMCPNYRNISVTQNHGEMYG